MHDERTGSPSKSADVGSRVTGPLPGRCRLAQLIVSGGVALVYRAHDEFLCRDVTTKAYQPTSNAADEQLG